MILAAKTLFSTLLGLQLFFQGKHQWPKDFTAQSFPLWRPYPSHSLFSWKFWKISSDNACMRTKYVDATAARMEFDYIVIGSGPGGSVVANRLSEDPTRTVLLVEAGYDPPVDSIVPQLFIFNLNTTRTWIFNAEPSNLSSKAYKGGVEFSSMKMLGGSTESNGMVYVRGHDQDYNAWAELGNVGWDFKSVLPYFKKSEDNTEPSTVDYKSKSFHGVGGYLPISNFTTNNSFVHVLRSAFGQIGVREIRDYNSGEHIGFVEIQGTIRGGERSSAARAFLLPIKSRSNIKIMKGSQVNKILFSGSKAIGVNVSTADKDCKNILLYASKEIIVSAGAVNSPKILLLSGIGRSEDLNTFGISQVKDLAVGDNLQDHPAAIFFLRVKPNSPEQTVFDLLSDVKDYFFHRSGTFSSVGSTSFHGYVNTTHPNATYPDAQFIFNHFRRSQKGLNIVFEKFGYRDEFIAQLLQVNINFELVLVYVNLFNPKSVGSVKLRSGNHWDAPKITTGYLKAHEDIDSLLRISKKLRELVTTPAMKEISAEIVKFNITECDLLPYPSDKYDKCYLSYFTQSGYHPSGTCKMGPGSDLNAVVDERLRVHGVQGLRVADASIMPRIPSANPQASIYMIGEKAADMIKEDWFDEQPKHTTVKTVTIKNREL